MMNKVKCKICGCEFVPESKNHYISRDEGKTGVVAVFQSNDETKLYDTFDCPQCGCQVVVQERKRSLVNLSDITDQSEEESDDERDDNSTATEDDVD